MKLFRDGIEIDSDIYSQTRVKLASSNEKIIFHPTFLITGFVFKTILEMKQSQNMMQGHFGISKTFSFILYAHLSHYVIDCLVKYDFLNKIKSSNLSTLAMLIKYSKLFSKSIQT